MNSILEGIEIGNEPDLFATHGIKSPNYTVKHYQDEFQLYLEQLQATGLRPVERFVRGGTFCCVDSFTRHQQSLMEHFQQYLYSWSYHHYPVHIKSPNPRQDGLAALLDDKSTEHEGFGIRNWSKRATELGIGFHMGECNSAPSGGIKGVSDTLAAALWSIDYLFVMATYNTTRINFHGGGRSRYSWFYWNQDTQTVTVQPLFYGMLLWNWITASPGTKVIPISCHGKACQSNNKINYCQDGIQNEQVCCASKCGKCGGSNCSSLPGGTDQCCTEAIAQNGTQCQTSTDVGCRIPPNIRVKVWALKDQTNNTKVVIINKLEKAAKIQLQAPYTLGEMVTLQAKSGRVNATKGLSFAGWTWPQQSVDGKREGIYNATKVHPLSQLILDHHFGDGGSSSSFVLHQDPASIMVVSFSHDNYIPPQETLVEEREEETLRLTSLEV